MGLYAAVLKKSEMEKTPEFLLFDIIISKRNRMTKNLWADIAQLLYHGSLASWYGSDHDRIINIHKRSQKEQKIAWFAWDTFT